MLVFSCISSTGTEFPLSWVNCTALLLHCLCIIVLQPLSELTHYISSTRSGISDYKYYQSHITLMFSCLSCSYRMDESINIIIMWLPISTTTSQNDDQMCQMTLVGQQDQFQLCRIILKRCSNQDFVTQVRPVPKDQNTTDSNHSKKLYVV